MSRRRGAGVWGGLRTPIVADARESATVEGWGGFAFGRERRDSRGVVGRSPRVARAGAPRITRRGGGGCHPVADAGVTVMAFSGISSACFRLVDCRDYRTRGGAGIAKKERKKNQNRNVGRNGYTVDPFFLFLDHRRSTLCLEPCLLQRDFGTRSGGGSRTARCAPVIILDLYVCSCIGEMSRLIN